MQFGIWNFIIPVGLTDYPCFSYKRSEHLEELFMARKLKITKKKLKEPDEFITLTERGLLFLEKHLKQIAFGAGIIVIILLVFLGFRWWDREREAKATEKFNSAVELLQKASSSYKEGTPAELKNSLNLFDELTRQYARTSSGKIALLYKGNLHLKLGEFEEAIKAYESLLAKSGIERVYHSFAMEGLGYAYEGKKEYEKALQAFKRALEKGEAFQSADAHLNIGRLCEKLGKNGEALENYRAYLKAAQKSQKTQFVLRKISLLEK